VSCRLLIGDCRQLLVYSLGQSPINPSHYQAGLQLFGPAFKNPFHYQARISLVSRLVATGFSVHELKTCFRNKESIQIVRIASSQADLVGVAGGR
jgi:hypothetical protein